MLWRVVVILMFVAWPLYYLGSGAYDWYRYETGTPTTATDIHCHVQRAPTGRHSGLSRAMRPQACTGTWSVDGQSHTGGIEGRHGGYHMFATTEVRVNGDKAYTADGAIWRLAAGATAAAIIALFVLLIRWIGPRQRSRESSLPRQT
jgi:hypothetical protein